MDYEVKLDVFEGPMDLLLHLIRKNEVDIFDIPIATITDQYLEYIEMLKALNINVAGDFLVMASTLTHIKSKMLLPYYDDEEEDPRVEITRPLLEYLRLKEIAGELSERELLGRDIFLHPLAPDILEQVQGEESLLNVSLFQLIDAFRRIVDELKPGTSLQFVRRKWSLKDRIAFIMNRVKQNGTVYFRDLFDKASTLDELIVTFLALLELAQTGLLRILQVDPDKDIRIEAHFTDDGETSNG